MRMEVKKDIFEYMEIFYSRERLHSFLVIVSGEYNKMAMVV